ncbi:glucokinase [Oxalobacteraceae bacterium GrIS 1.11]
MPNSVSPASPLATQPDAGFTGNPRLLADVGGTNARFALETAPGRIEAVSVLPCDDYASLGDAIRSYLTKAEVAALSPAGVRHAAIAIANPVDGDQIRMTNHHWQFSIEAVRVELGFSTFVVVNDFTALAMSLPHLTDAQKWQVGGGPARPGSAIGLIGAGTGLGVSGLIPANGHWIALQSEGGHVTFAPADEREIAILRFAWREFGHVSAERLMSGDGLELIYRALADAHGEAATPLSAPEISRRALARECFLCAEAVDCFCGMLGTIAGNLAMTLGTQGGIYIGGGIVPRLGERFLTSPFRQRFEQKGRFNTFLEPIPVFVITAEYPAFLGVSAILDERLAGA